MHFCGVFGPLSKGNFRHKMTTLVGNREHLWTSTLSPPKPQLRLSRKMLWVCKLSGPDPPRFLRVALRIEISTRCVFCVAGRIFIGFLSLPNLVLNLNQNMPKRLRVEAAYRSKTLAYCGSNPRFETSGPANSSTKMAY